ncbi:MAG: divergent PAP2 family protein [Bacilli bacterium]|nr:divergent PAP2 family protein [Bacilli bacterium]
MNKYLIVALSTLVICQVIKFIIESFRDKKIIIRRLLNGSGGMPSSHSALTSSLTSFIFLSEGGNSPLFAISLVFTMIVLYDSVNVRKESELHAYTINRLVDSLNKGNDYDRLNEEIGHEVFEVVAGVTLGILTSLLFYYIVF